MELKKKIRVLIVDDSLLFREVISRGVSSDRNIEVVAVAKDPFDARDKILQYRPDVMTCDVEMPKMNGIEFLRRLLPQYPLPVIVVSTVSEAVFDAMDAGALDFVTKPDVTSPKSVEGFLYEMISKIKVAAISNISGEKGMEDQRGIIRKTKDDSGRIIAIGASTGGTDAISKILMALPSDMPPILVVQHIPPVFSRMFAERLNTATNLQVKEAEGGEYVERGQVLIAPGDRHMKICRSGNRYKTVCFAGEKVNGHCPSVDVLFESVAKEAGQKATGVILTGMGHDGAKGLLSMKKAGAKTIGQDEKTCVVYGMPKVAYNIGAVEKQAALEKIPALL
ncbi:protein-glutamate methylesterase/protein-glutamine glutaminase [Parasporobacterium paucivorans]|uniref:Protein-glutamate methylesterase/protein-glutamine glutaminase n=1 Tax=Parasporobacterium paucivorans DSM 15970 TaxID=1122934 RepID=A0A1M6IAP2_9FIRM|nr:chemotaxis response regulator protein-glutamate methylesterase [Parasporobacterium paucivorans]SHJ31512.1 two-component system, chemotaxis family, response regulator CheB [Parasporobacterium paucivorans DSM 15970]